MHKSRRMQNWHVLRRFASPRKLQTPHDRRRQSVHESISGSKRSGPTVDGGPQLKQFAVISMRAIPKASVYIINVGLMYAHLGSVPVTHRKTCQSERDSSDSPLHSSLSGLLHSGSWQLHEPGV